MEERETDRNRSKERKNEVMGNVKRSREDEE